MMFLLLCLLTITTHAQRQYTESDYAKKPVWISMMNDSSANYFQVKLAYETYWQYHTPPPGESDMDIKEKEKNKKRFSQKDINLARENARMRMAIKKYHWWLEKMEPYVQEDGHIKR